MTAKLDNVSAVGLVIGERRVIHNARCIVLKESVTKAMGTVKRDALRDSMETRVITHVVLGVKEGHVTNRVEPAMLDANRTLQGVSVMVRTPIKFLIFFNKKYCISFGIKLIETEKKINIVQYSVLYIHVSLNRFPSCDYILQNFVIIKKTYRKVIKVWQYKTNTNSFCFMYIVIKQLFDGEYITILNNTPKYYLITNEIEKNGLNLLERKHVY